MKTDKTFYQRAASRGAITVYRPRFAYVTERQVTIGVMVSDLAFEVKAAFNLEMNTFYTLDVNLTNIV